MITKSLWQTNWCLTHVEFKHKIKTNLCISNPSNFWIIGYLQYIIFLILNYYPKSPPEYKLKKKKKSMCTLKMQNSTHTRYLGLGPNIQRIMSLFWRRHQNFPILLHQTGIKEQACLFKDKKNKHKSHMKLKDIVTRLTCLIFQNLTSYRKHQA